MPRAKRLNPAEAADRLGVSERQMRALAKSHWIGKKEGGGWTFTETEIRKLAQEQFGDKFKYATSDVFEFVAEGPCCHLGRADDMLKVSGQWVSPAEIEACALTVPDVMDAAVVGFPNEDGLTRIALFVMPRSHETDKPALEQALLATFKSTLSIYKCPRTIRFVDDLPRTATGKTQRFRLREMLKQPQ